jgi:hypothetical protein
VFPPDEKIPGWSLFWITDPNSLFFLWHQNLVPVPAGSPFLALINLMEYLRFLSYPSFYPDYPSAQGIAENVAGCFIPPFISQGHRYDTCRAPCPADVCTQMLTKYPDICPSADTVEKNLPVLNISAPWRDRSPCTGPPAAAPWG